MVLSGCSCAGPLHNGHARGRRVPDETLPITYRSYDYGRYAGAWWVKPPQPEGSDAIINLDNRWAVTEHEDGTITVSPSIHMYANNQHPEWHGFLEAGVWREC